MHVGHSLKAGSRCMHFARVPKPRSRGPWQGHSHRVSICLLPLSCLWSHRVDKAPSGHNPLNHPLNPKPWCHHCQTSPVFIFNQHDNYTSKSRIPSLWPFNFISRILVRDVIASGLSTHPACCFQAVCLKGSPFPPHASVSSPAKRSSQQWSTQPDRLVWGQISEHT